MKKIIKPLKKLLLIACILPLASFANSPLEKSFTDNQLLPVNLSDTNINRLVVQGDQITSVICPNGFCTSTHNADDQSGSALIKLNSSIPFTLFIQTANGHHVSLQVTPVQSDGKTLVLNPLSATMKAAKWEQQSSYKKMLITLAKAMMNNDVPEGFSFQSVKNADWKVVFNHLGKMQVKAIWQGAHVLGIQYLFYNDSSRALSVPDSAFYQPGVRLVATTEQTVPKHSYEFVYEIIDREHQDV